jgi:hypothetical protein
VIPKGQILATFTRINRDCVIQSVNTNTCNFVGNVGLLDSSDDLVSCMVCSESKDGMNSPHTLHFEEFINNFEKNYQLNEKQNSKLNEILYLNKDLCD